MLSLGYGRALSLPSRAFAVGASHPFAGIGTTEWAMGPDSMPGVGSSTTVLTDLSGNGFDLTNTVSKPVVAAGAGKAIDLTSGGDKFLYSGWPSRTFTTENWMWGMAFNRPNNDASYFYMGPATYSGTFSNFYTSGGARALTNYGNGADPSMSNFSYLNDTWTTVIAFVNTTTSTVTFYINGSDVTLTGSTGHPDWYPTTMALGNPGAAAPGFLTAGSFLASGVSVSDVAAAHTALADLYSGTPPANNIQTETGSNVLTEDGSELLLE